MNEKRDFPTEIPPAAGDHIGRLLRLAGPRPAAPHEREARVKTTVHTEWLAAIRVRRRRKWMIGGGFGLAAAAALLAMVGLVYQPTLAPEPVFEGEVGFFETVSGTVRLHEDSGGERPVRVGDVIEAGSVIDTGVLGRAAVRLASGHSLRLDRNTRLRGLSDSAVTLESGALYLDSGDAPIDRSAEIRTAFGVVYDVGTLFEVRLDREQIRVRVREGAINLDRDGQRYDAEAGIELTVDAGGVLTRRSVPIFGPEWDWILAVAPTFELEGSTLDVFLEWVNRETGWSARFLDPRSEAAAPGVVLHGSVEGMRPDQALAAVLPTCGLVHRVDGGILVIQAEGP